MAYFAKGDQLANVEIDGGIEITGPQYKAAIAAKMDPSKEALVLAGALVIRDRAPSPDHTWVGGAWQAPPDPEPVPVEAITPAQVKAEANRRIVAIMPEYKQRNAIAFGLEMVLEHGPDPANWPADMQNMNAAVQAQWAAIKLIRQRSDAIEVMDPIPQDFATNEDLWQAQ